MNENLKYILATVAVLLFGLCYIVYAYYDEISFYLFPPESTEVHVHADFAFYLLGNRVDLTNDIYQSTAESTKHPTMHFHDGVDTMIHRHAEGITFSEFFSSLGFMLTDTCITTDTDTPYCTDEQNSLLLFVNGNQVQAPSQYIIQEEDRILLYYGDPTDPSISTFQDSITDEACIYSGNCPERGDPPFETCGISCEI